MISRRILSFFNRITSKRNRIIFNSFPDISDSPLALYLYIINNREDLKNKYKLYWAVSGSVDSCLNLLKTFNVQYSHSVVKKKSIKGLFLFLSARFLITSHGYFGGLNNNPKQMHVNLWHGMPLKTIGNGLKKKSSTGFELDADYTIATSELFRKIVASCFGIGEEKVLLTGLPRNDFLLTKGLGLNALGVSSIYDKIIMWMPTYRKSVVGDLRNDGNVNGFGIKDILFDSFEEVDAVLKEKNYLLIVKPHPMDELAGRELPSSSNILSISDGFLKEHGVVLYQVLADTDVLVTDYSSVFIDYLITGNPIAFACNDIVEYENTRGFCFENIRDYLPGELIESKEKFIDYLNCMDEYNARWMEKYKKVRKQFIAEVDDLSSKRVCDMIWGERG